MKPNIAERIAEIHRIASTNEFWTLGSGDHLNMVDTLLEEVERQAEEIERLRRALEFYAKEENYHNRQYGAAMFVPASIEEDMGQRAREALRRDTQE